MQNITRFSRLFLFLYYFPKLIYSARKRYHPINSRSIIFNTIIMWSIACLIPLEIRIRHIFKKSVLYDVKPCFLHLSILSAEIWKKSLAFRQRTKLSTQPFIYRISVSGKLSTRPFIYHISVSGKLSLY